MVVHHRAPGARCYIGGARWSCTIVHRVQHAILVVHDGLAPSCTGFAMLYWWGTMAVHYRVPGATCYIGGARWSCTIVHRVHDTIVMVHDGRAPFRTGCAMLHWWGTMVVHHCAAGAQCYIGAPHWLCTILHRVHDAKLLWHDGHAPSCTGCAMPYWWGTMVVHHRPPGATCYIAVAQWSCIIVQRVHNGILVLPHGRAPSCTGCPMLY